MPVPTGWPPRPSSGVRSIRFYKTGTTSNAFDDNAYLFIDATSANTYVATPVVRPGGEVASGVGSVTKIGTLSSGGSPMGGGQAAGDANPTAVIAEQAVPKAMIWAHGIRITNTGANALVYSFDGTNTHGFIVNGTSAVFNHRHEAGIALKSAVADNATTFHVEAW